MSEWITIDRLGTVGLEADRISSSRAPASLDVATNVRAVGKSLGNAGGYALVAQYPNIGQVSASQVSPLEVTSPGVKVRASQVSFVEVVSRTY